MIEPRYHGPIELAGLARRIHIDGPNMWDTVLALRTAVLEMEAYTEQAIAEAKRRWPDDWTDRLHERHEQRIAAVAEIDRTMATVAAKIADAHEIDDDDDEIAANPPVQMCGPNGEWVLPSLRSVQRSSVTSGSTILRRRGALRTRRDRRAG